jgi:hypothetical protein
MPPCDIGYAFGWLVFALMTFGGIAVVLIFLRR